VDAALSVRAAHATTGAGSRFSTYARRSAALISRERPSLTLGSSPQRIRSYTRGFETLSRSATSSAVKQSWSMVLSFRVGWAGSATGCLPVAWCISGGAGECGITGSEPPLSDEAEFVEHADVLGGGDDIVRRCRVRVSLELLAVAVVLAPCIAQRAEGGREPPGLAGEVSSESEGVGPLSEQCVGAREPLVQERAAAQLEAGLSELLQVAIR